MPSPRDFARALIAWFAQNKVQHSFYEDRNPYRVWVSEVCLQQTRLEAAIPKLEFFLQNFDSVQKLAQADTEQVLAAFAGLGYYNRARNLHKGARLICKKFNGELPQSPKELMTIPSIGHYTANAIASICYGQNVIAVDGNVKRVVARILAIDESIDSRQFAESIEFFLNELKKIPLDDRYNYSEALMQMGQNLCKAKNPHCTACFFRKKCKAFQQGKVEQLPRKIKQAEKIDVDLHLYFFKIDNKFFLHKWDGFLFLNNHWGPLAVADSYDSSIKKWQSFAKLEEPSFKQTISSWLKKIKPSAQENPMTKHSITRYGIHVYAQNILLDRRNIPLQMEKNYFFTAEQAEKLLVSSIYQKINWKKL